MVAQDSQSRYLKGMQVLYYLAALSCEARISIVNAPGLIDSNYRGEAEGILLNTDSNDSFTIEIGDRIAQLIVMPIPTINRAGRGIDGIATRRIRFRQQWNPQLGS